MNALATVPVDIPGNRLLDSGFFPQPHKVELDLNVPSSLIFTVRSNRGPGHQNVSGRVSLWIVMQETPMTDTFYEYLDFYKKFAVNWWNHIGPADYITLLMLVGVIGYLTMLRGNKRLA